MAYLDNILFAVASVLQLAAVVYCLWTMREVGDRRPWIVMMVALGLMLAYRVVAIFVPNDILAAYHASPIVSIPISATLFISLFYIRHIATAERENRELAQLRTAERDDVERRYQALADLSPDAMFVHLGGRIVYANDAALRLFGATDAEQLLGRSPFDFMTARTREVAAERLKQLEVTGSSVPPLRQEWVRMDGLSVSVEAAAATVPWMGMGAIQVILRDISERVKAEDEKTRALAAEREARAMAEHAGRMKDEFLATLSHELRTPLNAILGWSQILRAGANGPEDLEQGLETIERNAHAQTRLIEDLLDMSRIISGKLRLDVQRVSPITVIEAAITAVMPSADAKGVRVDRTLDPAAGPVSGDPGRLQQVVWNLLSNAIKFTPRGGRVQVLLERVNSHVEITVADTGQGIAAEFLPSVFDRFAQADATTTRRFGGLGLGLSIVKQLAELHGGRARAKSDGVGKGSTFTVELPLAAVLARTEGVERTHPESRNGQPTDVAGVDMRGLQVLVVDDEPDALVLIRRLLERHGAGVTVAGSADEALTAFGRAIPDVVISDIGMPGKDGYEFMREVRGMGADRGGRVPAVALTAFARSEDRTRAMVAGYQVHLSKPIEAAELVATVGSLAGRTGGAQH